MTGSLVVATYNLHGFRGSDGVRDAGRTLAVLQELDADLIAMQEVADIGNAFGPGPDAARLALPGYRRIVAPTLSSRGGYGNAVLTRFDVRGVDVIDLSRHGREPRAALDLEVDIGVGGACMRVITAHLGLWHGERRTQVARLLERVSERPAPFLTVLGDFNDWLPGTPALRVLERTLGASPRVRSFPAARPLLALDRIWVHPGSALLDLWTHRTRCARRASDHLPVLARLALPEPPH